MTPREYHTEGTNPAHSIELRSRANEEHSDARLGSVLVQDSDVSHSPVRPRDLPVSSRYQRASPPEPHSEDEGPPRHHSQIPPSKYPEEIDSRNDRPSAQIATEPRDDRNLTDPKHHDKWLGDDDYYPANKDVRYIHTDDRRAARSRQDRSPAPQSGATYEKSSGVFEPYARSCQRRREGSPDSYYDPKPSHERDAATSASVRFRDEIVAPSAQVSEPELPRSQREIHDEIRVLEKEREVLRRKRAQESRQDSKPSRDRSASPAANSEYSHHKKHAASPWSSPASSRSNSPDRYPPHARHNLDRISARLINQRGSDPRYNTSNSNSNSDTDSDSSSDYKPCSKGSVDELDVVQRDRGRKRRSQTKAMSTRYPTSTRDDAVNVVATGLGALMRCVKDVKTRSIQQSGKGKSHWERW